MNLRTIRDAALLVACLSPALSAYAATNVTPAELAVLPGYCDAKIGSRNPAAVARWSHELGQKNWDHMHHYCGGLIELNRFYGASAAKRKTILHDAMWEFDYVLKNTQPDFFLRPEMHYNRGRVWELQGNDGEAVMDFQRAIELSPGMPSATMGLADIYKKLGKKEQALAALKSALEQFPDNKGLQRRYVELGGDLASLKPAAPADATQAADKAAGTAAEDAPEPAAPSPATGAGDAKIGNATNPWCRFCPDPPAPKNDKQ